MKSKNLVALSLIAPVLLCSGLVSVAAAEDPDTTPLPKIATDSVDADSLPPSSPDNSTQDLEPIYEDEHGEPAYHILDDNNTSPVDAQEPATGGEEANLISARTAAGPDYTLIVAGIAVVLAVALGTVGVVYHQKRANKEA
jgi:hypothetical protein